MMGLPAPQSRDRLYVVAWPKGWRRRLGAFHAFRCVDCRHDQVLDPDRQLWDLDDSDYGDEGSTP